MEELLNKLIKKGWRPNGKYDGPHKPFIRLYKDKINGIQFYYNERRDGEYRLEKAFSLRDIVSVNSGLWQFVCENGMVNQEHKHERILDPTFGEGWADCKRQEHDGNYGYRLIESVLKDESELEQFLLDNIKIDE